ncbi:hypothetical protein ATO7_13543 [Oceanococcus atlanticus]|uniref:DUF502 domain-containing protein n=2 Tax=Oceanococcus atlanticus TaxID=1317117 RepID=A0A1Y1SDQ1_9GAMM|nr:hypothetical protein ATO7_13543 [Oceanococcus atlanticus]
MKITSLMRRWLIAGLLVWLPLVATLLVLRLVVELLDKSLVLLPPPWRPENLLGVDVPGLGIVLSLIIVLGTGATVANIIGRRVVEVTEAALERIPLVRSVYGGVKKLTGAVMSGDSQTFRKVLLVQYPRRDCWTLAFQTADPARSVSDKAGDVVTVYVPTTPNPTSGFVVFLPRADVQELDMSIEDALQLIMTLGVVTPEKAALEARAAKS